MAHETIIDVRFSELDPYGHVNHAVYLTYFEQARCEALIHCGIPIESIAERGYQLVVTELTARFLRSAGPGDRVTVETRLGRAAPGPRHLGPADRSGRHRVGDGRHHDRGHRPHRQAHPTARLAVPRPPTPA